MNETNKSLNTGLNLKKLIEAQVLLDRINADFFKRHPEAAPKSWLDKLSKHVKAILGK